MQQSKKFLFLSIVIPGMVYASLGSNVDSVTKDGEVDTYSHLMSNSGEFISSRSVKKNGYSITSLTDQNGTHIREFSGADARVFAIAWNGPTYPNFKQILGVSGSKVKTAKKSGDLLNNVTLTGEDFVLQMGGHPGNYRGKSYIPSMLPQNFSLLDLK